MRLGGHGFAAAALLLLCAHAPRAAAQGTAEAFLYEGDDRNTVHASVEMDPALAVGVGYMRAVPVDIGRFHRRLGVHADLRGVIGFTSWDLAGGVSMFLAEGAGFNVLVRTDLELKLVQNRVHTGLVYGYDASARAGYFDPVAYVAAELSVHGTFGAQLWHRDAYREAFPQAEDGAYLLGQANLFVGLGGGFQIEQRVLIGARFAWRFAGDFEDYAPYFQPYTINADVGVRF